MKRDLLIYTGQDWFWVGKHFSEGLYVNYFCILLPCYTLILCTFCKPNPLISRFNGWFNVWNALGCNQHYDQTARPIPLACKIATLPERWHTGDIIIKVKIFKFDWLITFCFGVSSNVSQQKSPTAEILGKYFLRIIVPRKYMPKIPLLGSFVAIHLKKPQLKKCATCQS